MHDILLDFTELSFKLKQHYMIYLNNTMVSLTWWGRVALFALGILLHTGKVLYADYPTSDLRSEKSRTVTKDLVP